MNRYYMMLYTLLILTCSLFADDSKEAAFAFAHHVNYSNSISPSAYSQKKLDQNTALFYTQWKKDYLVKAGKNYRIATDKKDKHRTVSEGQGYGMVITAYMAGYDKDAKTIFDGLYHFAKTYPSTICKDFMTWQVPAKKGESDSAFDGDADIAYALLLADKQWGSDGTINYQKEARKIISSLMRYVIGRESYLPLLGDWVDQKGKKYNQYTTRSSDFMLSHFRAFYTSSGDKRWLKVVKACQNAMLDIQNLPRNKTALVSDFLYFDAQKQKFLPASRHFLETEDNSYYYNACRVPFRVGIDALLYHDRVSKSIVERMTRWIQRNSQNNTANIKSGYTLEGKVIGDYFSTVFAAPFGVSTKVNPEFQAFLDDIYEHIKSKHENYFEDSINLLSQLIISNNYWDPSLR